MDPPSLDEKAGGLFDAAWECDAPMFIDFTDAYDAPDVDTWFDRKEESEPTFSSTPSGTAAHRPIGRTFLEDLMPSISSPLSSPATATAPSSSALRLLIERSGESSAAPAAAPPAAPTASALDAIASIVAAQTAPSQPSPAAVPTPTAEAPACTAPALPALPAQQPATAAATAPAKPANLVTGITSFKSSTAVALAAKVSTRAPLPVPSATSRAPTARPQSALQQPPAQIEPSQHRAKPPAPVSIPAPKPAVDAVQKLAQPRPLTVPITPTFGRAKTSSAHTVSVGNTASHSQAPRGISSHASYSTSTSSTIAASKVGPKPLTVPVTPNFMRAKPNPAAGFTPKFSSFRAAPGPSVPSTPVSMRSSGYQSVASTPSSVQRMSKQPASAVPLSVKKLTVPVTPEFVRRSRAKSQTRLLKTTEELELERIEREREQLRKSRESAAQTVLRNVASAAYLPVRSSRPLTEPQEFNFHTECRVRSRSSSVSEGSSGSNNSSFTRSRSNSFSVQSSHSGASSSLAAAVAASSRSSGATRPVANPSARSSASGPPSFAAATSSFAAKSSRPAKSAAPAAAASSTAASQRKTTQPAPFSFASAPARAPAAPQSAKWSPYSSLASKIDAFSSKTPERYRTLPAGSSRNAPPPSVSKTSQPKRELTVPVSPKFSTISRTRAHPVPSTQERELLEMQAAPKFKAHQVNTRVMESRGDYGVPRIPKREVTDAHSPALMTKKRVVERQPSSSAADASTSAPQQEAIFHAHPVPHRIFDAVVGVPERTAPKITIPESPDFPSKHLASAHLKSRPSADSQPTAAESRAFHANPVPSFDHVFQPVYEARITVPEPFSFEGKYKEKTELIHELQEQEMRELAHKRQFHAHPAPNFFAGSVSHDDTDGAPAEDSHGRQHQRGQLQRAANGDSSSNENDNGNDGEDDDEELGQELTLRTDIAYSTSSNVLRPQHIPRSSHIDEPHVTVPQPFNLESERRHEEALHRWQEQVAREREREAAAASSFRAKPATVIEKLPFVPQRSSKPLTDMVQFQLNTEIRSQQRSKLDEERQEKQLIEEQVRMEREREMEIQEARAIAELRQSLVHKPEPIRWNQLSSRPFVHSERPLTVPESPVFATTKRLRSIRG